MPQIQNLQPSRVVHELILKPFGTYIIRNSTENDDILSQIKINSEIKSISYVVLSVRVDENEYYSPIMNYRLPLIKTNNQYDLIEYYKQSENNASPELDDECIIETLDTNWKIDQSLFRMEYMGVFDSHDKDIKSCMRYNIEAGYNQIKVIKKATKNAKHEFSILKNLSYFHIVTFYGICDESDDPIKSLVFADHGESLKTKYPYIKYSNELMIKQLSMIGYQIACGMIYLELKGIIHRDLHAGNILIDEKNFIRIADFEHGIIKHNDNEKSQESAENPKSNFQRRRLAPECLPWLPESEEAVALNKTLFSEFSSKSDVWAYGLIFIELILDAQETCLLVQYIKLDEHIHEKPDDCPENFYDLLKQCWIYSRGDRISFVDLRNEMMRLFKLEN